MFLTGKLNSEATTRGKDAAANAITAPAEKTAAFRMANMDKLFSTCGFDFADMEELIAELPTEHDMWDAPGFDRVLFHADPSGMAVTAMEYEGEWAAVPSYRGGEEAPGTIYRATPYIGIVETGDLRFAALADAPFALPAGNPVGGEKLQGQVRPAVVALKYEVGEPEEFSLTSPATERFYRNFKPSMLNPQVEVAGTIGGVAKHSNELGMGEFWICDLDGLPLIVNEKLEVGQGIRAHGIALCATEFWNE